MGIDEQLTFADEVGRFYARTFSMPPIHGSVLGWLLVCDPPQQTAAQMSIALQASRSAIGSAVGALDTMGYVRRSRVAGERAERIALRPDVWTHSLDDVRQYVELAELSRQGLEALDDAPSASRGRLLEAVAFYDFLAERLPALAVEWRARREALHASSAEWAARRDALRASGELTDPD